ncbi:tyrosine-type recombinase/integrase [Patescibacteria group bacterium]
MAKSVNVPKNLDSFKGYLLRRKLAEGTVKTVTLCIRRIREVYGLSKLTPLRIEKLFQILEDEGCSKNYLANYRHAIAKLCQFKGVELDIPPVKKRRDFKPEFVSDSIVKQLYSFPKRKGAFGRSDWMWNLVIELMAKTGLTREQVINLKVNDVDLESKLIRVRYKRRFSIPIPNDMLDKLKEWTGDKPKRHYLFSVGGEVKTWPASVNKVFWKRLEKLGVTTKVSPRILRHNYLKKLVERRLPLSELRRLAGGVNLRHLNRYFEIKKTNNPSA